MTADKAASIALILTCKLTDNLLHHRTVVTAAVSTALALIPTDNREP